MDGVGAANEEGAGEGDRDRPAFRAGRRRGVEVVENDMKRVGEVWVSSLEGGEGGGEGEVGGRSTRFGELAS